MPDSPFNRWTYEDQRTGPLDGFCDGLDGGSYIPSRETVALEKPLREAQKRVAEARKALQIAIEEEQKAFETFRAILSEAKT